MSPKDHAYQQVNGVPVRDICGLCGDGPGGHMTEASAINARVVRESVTSWLDTPEYRNATQADVQRLEAKVDRLIVALRAGAIGQWGNEG